MNNVINADVLVRKQQFAALKAQNEAKQKAQQARLEALQVAYAAVPDDEPDAVLKYIAHTDSALGKTLYRGIQFVAGQQLLGYLKRDPDELPVMSIGDLMGLEERCHVELLSPTLAFMGVDSLKELGQPRRAMVSSGVLGAAYELVSRAVLNLNNNRKHKGVDAFLAQMINRVIGSSLDFELPNIAPSIYDWDVSPVQGNKGNPECDEERTDENANADNGQSYSWG